MPKNKDLKRLVRARMKKTGESYTTARAHITGTASPALPADYEGIAGMSDEAVARATAKRWPEWTTYLDELGATEMPHKEIAAHLVASFDFGGWWAQSVTVGYERLRGLRDVGQQRGGGYDVNKSKTFAVSVEALWAAFVADDVKARWLDDSELTFHKLSPMKSMRGGRTDGTKVDVSFTDKGPAKSTVTIQHRKIQTKAQADGVRREWTARLDRLKALLTP